MKYKTPDNMRIFCQFKYTTEEKTGWNSKLGEAKIQLFLIKI